MCNTIPFYIHFKNSNKQNENNNILNRKSIITNQQIFGKFEFIFSTLIVTLLKMNVKWYRKYPLKRLKHEN